MNTGKQSQLVKRPSGFVFVRRGFPNCRLVTTTPWGNHSYVNYFRIWFVLAVALTLWGCGRALRVEVPAGEKPVGMAWIPAGKFLMGGPTEEVCHQVLSAADPKKPCCSLLQAGFTDSQPAHEVEVDGFWMDETEVTNAEFRTFIEATRYVTVAERQPRREDFPGAADELLVPGSV